VKLKRLRDAGRPEIRLTLDGTEIVAQEGDTLLTALLAAGAGYLCRNTFTNEPRSGSCLMGACQDCWVMVPGAGRMRACTTPAQPGMEVRRA
jgi:NADH dehydrogenase/NADH:ubiquinone oxidoreductase subunit G